MRTVNGLEVRIYATDGAGVFPIHGAVSLKFMGGWVAMQWASNGQAFSDGPSELDIMEYKQQEAA